jgi:ribosomal protein S18 acetylase RimI-like enzyme
MNEQIAYLLNQATEAEIMQHLRECDTAFMPRLSQRLDLHEYARKIFNHAVRFEAWSGGTLVGLVAAYCNDEKTRRAFITSVSVLEHWRGRGIAGILVRQCTDYAGQSAMRLVSLEVARSDAAAIKVYKRSGFVPGEARADSIMMHLTLDPRSSADPDAMDRGRSCDG